jgi:hypothetical protein
MLLTCASATRELLSAAKAGRKVVNLEEVLTRYYPNWKPYAGEKTIDSVKIALAYVVAQKNTKITRKVAGAAATTAFGAAGEIIGGAAGTFVLPIPVVGAAVGVVAGGQVLSKAPLAATTLYRTVKKGYKWGAGTLGVHRKQAATILYYAYKEKADLKSTDHWAAYHGLDYILHGINEVYLVDTATDKEEAISLIAKRMKSW